MSTTTRSARRTSHRCDHRRAGGLPGLAAEHAAAYGSASAAASRGPLGVTIAGPDEVAPDVGVSSVAGEIAPGPGGSVAPFGLAVLAEVPRLASVLDHLAVADGAQLAAVAELAELLRGDGVERTTGVGVEHWLAAVGRLTRMDRRLLVRTCRLLHRLPSLDAAVRDGRVSFAQLRGLVLALRGVRGELDGRVDRLLAALLDGLDRLDRPDPDVLVRQVTDAVDELDPDDLADRERDATAGRFLALQPRLDGTGGKLTGDLDAAGLALVDAATAPTAVQVAEAGGVGPARADLLLERLAASEGGGCDQDHRPRAAEAEVAEADASEGPADSATGSGGGVSWWGRLAPPKLLVRLRFETLLDPAVPAELLTTLVGGRLKLTGHAARRLSEERGALLRTVVVDDHGAVIGVGRATRRPPGWLTDANMAVHDCCTGPGCDRPATTAQLDHATPWWPPRPDQPAGTTDVDNLGPLCDATNRDKEAAGWHVAQSVGGIRTWHHPRSGLTCTTVPATWRPAGDPRHHTHRARRDRPDDDDARHRRRPPGTDPPGPERTGPAPRGPNTSTPDRHDLPF